MTDDFPAAETEKPGVGNTPRPKKSAAKKSARKRPSPTRMEAGESSAFENDDENTSRAGRVLNKGRKVLSRAYDHMPDMHMPRRRDFESMMEANPLILGAVGLGLGVVIGSLLPRNTIDGGMQAMGLSSRPSSASRRSGSASRKGGSSRSRGRSSSRGGGSSSGGNGSS